MRVRGLDHTTVPVRDQFRAARFYAVVFNGEVDHVGRGFLNIAPESIREGLDQSPHQGMGIQICNGFVIALFDQDFGQPTVEQSHPHHAFAVGPYELEAWVAQLERWKVPYFGPIGRTRGRTSVSVYFNDPDGNHLEFVSPDTPEEIRSKFPTGHEDRAPENHAWPPADLEEAANGVLREKLLAAHARGLH